MATTSKYYVLTPSADNLDFLDFDLRYGSVTTVGETIQYNGTARVDSVFVRPGLTYDLTNTSGGADKIYFTGNLADYTGSISGTQLNLSRTVNGKFESVTVAGGTSLNFDTLVFANGSVATNTLYTAINNATALPTPSLAETSLAPIGAAAPGAPLNATIKAYSTNTAGFGQVGETFASTRPGISLIVNGGNAIDTVYVADGEVVDATVLGGSIDLVYFRGTWADYTKSIVGGNKLLFTRTINGNLESVTVTAGTSLNYDKLIFADGAITTIDAKNIIITNPTGPGPTDPGITTPLYPDDVVLGAINAIRDAAEGNTATPTTPSALTYAIAGAKGVDASNLASINSALDSTAVNGAAVDTTPEIQTVVDAYKAILASADGVAANTATPLTGAQYTAIGVTGVSGTAALGNALHLLDDVVDASPRVGVDTVPEVQAMADAANRVMAAAGGTPAQAAALTQADLAALGVTGVTAANLAAIQAAIQATVPDAGVDTQAELQGIVNATLAGAANALNIIAAAAQANNATATTPSAAVYATAGVSGVDASNLASMSSALNSAAVDGAAADTTPEVQAIVNAYNAILASADAVPVNTATPLTGAQYTAIGVTGVSGTASAGNPLFLLNDAVDASARAGVDTVPEVQAMADAAARVIAAAGGTAGQIAALTQADLAALGVTGVTAGNLAAIQAAIGATVPDSGADTLPELQAIVNATITAAGALNIIAAAAQANNATATTPAASVYATAGVTGVDGTNLASISSALNSAAVDGPAADTTPEVQAIVNAYNAILASADGVGGNTATPLTGAQYTAIGVTGVSGTAAPGNTMYLLDDVVDATARVGVDTVPEVQAIADAAGRLLAAAGGTPAQIAALTLADFSALGITGVAVDNLAAIQAAIGATVPDSLLDTRAEIQSLVNIAGVVNHAPVLDPSKSPTLGSIDTTVAPSNPVGAVGTLVSALVNTTGIANFSDVDAGTQAGMAITGYSTALGTLYYSTNNGGSWSSWTPSGSNALHLLADSNTRLYFKPLANAFGDAGITFNAWDQSNSLANGAVAAIGAVGGSTAYSSATDSIGESLTNSGGYRPVVNYIQAHDVTDPGMAAIGNFNGDGYMDLITRAVTTSNGYYFLHTGSSAGADSNFQSMYSATPTMTGNSIATLDFNGDGYADLTTGNTDASPTGERNMILGNNVSNSTVITGYWTYNSQAVHTAAGSGDYNGDGYQDLFMCSDYSGSANLVYGNPGAVLNFNSNNASVGVAFTNSATYFGSAGSNLTFFKGAGSAYMGDSNCDGLSDVAFVNTASGQVFVKFGTATQVATLDVTTATVGAAIGNGFVISGLPTTELAVTYFGTIGLSVAPAGDVNGDGYADLLVMSPVNNSAYVIYGKPNGSVADINVNTMTANQGFKITASNSSWLFGLTGASAGDVNGDGYSDVIIGAPGKISEGAGIVVFGGATGAHGNLSADSSAASGGWTTTLDFSGMTSAQYGTPYAGVGLVVGSSAGDINGDGLSDFFISSTQYAGNQSAPIVVYGDTNLSSLQLNPLIRSSLASGSTAAERLIGTSGIDTLSGGGGADAISAGAGNDTVLIHDANFLHLDGGLGTDTLKLDATASGVNLDFTTNGLGGRVVGFEGMDLTGGGNNTLKLTVQDVLHQANVVNSTLASFNEAHLLVVSGNAGDSLLVSATQSLNPGGWSIGSALSGADRAGLSSLGYQFVLADNYTVYTNGLATLVVDNAVSFQVV